MIICFSFVSSPAIVSISFSFFLYNIFCHVINGKLEGIYDRTEFTDDEWTEMEKNRLDMIVQYKADKDSLEKATVTAVLTEMQLWNSII